MNEQEQIFFVKGMLPHANSAETFFHLNPIVTLAQAALESGWGKSNLALKGNNFFGLTAYGKSNDYWHGGVITLLPPQVFADEAERRRVRDFIRARLARPE